MFDSLKHKIVDQPKAKMWTMGAGTFVTKKKVVISGCLLPLITTKHSFNMEGNTMQDSNQLHAVILGQDLMHQFQLKPDIVENKIQWLDVIILMVPYEYWNKSRIDAFCSRKMLKLETQEKDKESRIKM